MTDNELAIERLKNIKTKVESIGDSVALDVAISALKGGWIPITEEEKLPEHDVICCDNEGDIDIGYLYFDEEENQIACDHDPYVMFGIVAYMELPEPYKKGE